MMVGCLARDAMLIAYKRMDFIQASRMVLNLQRASNASSMHNGDGFSMEMTSTGQNLNTGYFTTVLDVENES